MLRLILTLITSTIGLLLVLPLFLLVIPFWLLNSLVSAIDAALRKGATSWDNLVRFDPDIGWRPQSNIQARYLDINGDSHAIETDQDGWPCRQTIEESDVVVFGDSFAFGYGISVHLAFYSVSQSCRIKAIGAPGYSMVQQLLLMRKYVSRLRGKLVVWLVCMENDLADNLEANLGVYASPFLRSPNGTEEWEIVAQHLQPCRWHYDDHANSNLFAHICVPSPFSERVFSAARHLIQAGRDTCVAAGAHLAVFAIPYYLQLSEPGVHTLRKRVNNADGFDPRYPEGRIATICREMNVPLIAGAADLGIEDYKKRDGHWSRRGNRKVAALIESYFRKTQEP